MRILIAVISKELRAALKSFISFHNDYDVIFEANDPKSFFKNLSNYKFELVILNWGFFNSKSTEIIKLVKTDHPGTAVICMDISKSNQRDAIKAKADAFYFETDPPGDLIELIDRFRSYN